MYQGVGDCLKNQNMHFLVWLLQVIKQRLQKTKEGSRYDSGKQRSSSVAGSHSALSLTAPPALLAAQVKAATATLQIPVRNMNRFQRNSVEGLNVVRPSVLFYCSMR